MSHNDLVSGLDIGSNSIRLAITQRVGDFDSKPNVVGVVETQAEGINRGVITSIDDAVSSISACLEKAERIVGVPIEEVWVGISGSHITSQESKGVVAAAKANGEITEDDVERAIEAARTVATPPNYEILHVIPKSFTVDGQSGIKDPIGMTGVRLEVDTQIIQGLSSQIKNITKAIYRTGIEIEDIVLSILATSEAVVTNRQKQLGCCVINIGGSTTSMAVFEEGDVMHTAILPVGSEHITSDIAIGLRISIDAAETLKLEHGSSFSKGLSKREDINVGELNNSESYYISKKYLAEIIEARVEEIFEKIDDELKKIDRSGMLPAGVVLTGGGSKLPGIIDVAKINLKLPASLGYPIDVAASADRVNDLNFTTALGLALWGHHSHHQKTGEGMRGLFKMDLSKVSKKMKNIFKSMKKKD